MIFEVVLLLLLFYALGQSSKWVVDSLMGLGLRLRISKFILAFVVLGIATSASEFLVAFNAVITRVPTLSLGNVIGASLVLLTLVAGLSIILNKQINIFRAISFRELLVLNLVIILPGALVLDGFLSRVDGLILIAAYAGYIGYIISKKNILSIPDGLDGKKKEDVTELIGFLIFGLLIMTLSAKYAVDIGTDLAFGLGIPPLAVGLLIFSIGTNLPELAITFETRTATKKYILFGDLLGSSAANSLVIGLVAFFQPIRVSDLPSVHISVLFLATTLIALNIAALTQSRIVRKEGIFLIGIYVLFVVTSILLNIL